METARIATGDVWDAVFLPSLSLNGLSSSENPSARSWRAGTTQTTSNLTTGSRATARFTDTKSSAGGRFMNKTEIWKQRKQRPKGERNWRPSCFAKVIYTITICCPRPNLRGYVKGYRPFRISTESLSRGSRSTVWKLNTKINYEKTRKNRHNMRVLQTWYVVDSWPGIRMRFANWRAKIKDHVRRRMWRW